LTGAPPRARPAGTFQPFAQTASLLRLSPAAGGTLFGTSAASGPAAGAAAVASAGAALAAGTLGPPSVSGAGGGATAGAHAGATSPAHGGHVRKHSAPSYILPPFQVATTVIDHIVKVIPTGVWIALAAALGLALVAGASALRERRRVRHQEGQIAAVSAAALTDSLTGVLNRRGFTEAVDRELARARRYKRPFVFAYVDVRGLKAVNDTEGHLAGDQLLKGVATLLRASARADDVVGRIGGDELGLLLPEQTAEGAEAMVRRIESQLPVTRKEVGLRAPWDLTIGTAAYPEDGKNFDELLATADRRLYEQRGIALR
jgi:diguanylate cyclase (GGDEF)-like protein